ncbi:carbohydrate-binding module family 48 protein [Suhomyces tanzawaensis NRRL Y-17324]|uniref:Carbohydrate-binding module family 48 protein n=1 Tax=Suhomyces tanzawaensis NRRL Y-17324 TaxID=984487 RepID=A0A1E4SFJ6_9ASCO|nr:carbohydrate-binding module family 48 protein [Suhomyces tanzawaensis NRRL Y-17324]ODV78281.1 carbohydrate-binding module family 48 protein [Suhomyces tanzawaensis NRRL Y-17324]
MGNTSSTTTRKSTAGQRLDVRKSLSGSHSARGDSLYDDFNDSILHPVKREAPPPLVPVKQDPNYTTQNQFTNDLIEDEFNELNDGLIETEATNLARNILPNSEFDTSIDMDDAMDIDDVPPGNTTHEEVFPSDSLPEPTDLSKVDFTKITNQSPFNRRTNMSDMRLSQYQNQQPNHKKARNNNYTYQSSTMETLIPVEIKWVNSNKEPINKISIIGSFSNWRDIIKLVPSPSHDNEYITTITLPLGVHKLLYIINNEYRVSDQLPTATDQEGIFFNWFEVIDEAHLFNHSNHQTNHPDDASTAYDANIISPDYHNHFQRSTSSVGKQQAGKYDVGKINRKSNSFLAKISKESSNFEHVEYLSDLNQDLEEFKQSQQHSENYPYGNESHANSNKYVPYHETLSSTSLQKGDDEFQNPPLEYSSEIPEMFVNYDYFKNKSPNYELPEPPQLPAHLNNVLLNKISNSSNNGSQGQLTNIPQIPSSYHHPSSADPLRPPHAGYMDGSASSSGTSSTSTSHFKRPPLRRADSSYYASNKEAYHLSIPNHVILNHLMTTSIRNEVLTVACITRYSGKFVTQIMHSPADK